MSTSIPVTTLSNLRKNLVPPSLLDLLYIQQGSEHDRDSAISLGQFAEFLQLGKFTEITLNGSNGKQLVLNGNGITYTKPPTTGTLDQYTITENDSGIQIAIDGPQGNRLVKVAAAEISISRKRNGLESKVVISESGLSISKQTMDGTQVVTKTSTLDSGELDLAIVKLLGSAGDWLFETQTTTESNERLNVGDLWIGRGLGTLSAHIFSKLCFWRQVYFDEDVEIRGNLDFIGNRNLTVYHAEVDNLTVDNAEINALTVATLLSILGTAANWDFKTRTDETSGKYTQGDLYIGNLDHTASLAAHVFAKLCVWKQAYFDKDVEINGDVVISGGKTLTVTGGCAVTGYAVFNNGVGFKDFVNVEGGLSHRETNVELDTTKNSAVVKCSESANPTLPNYWAGRRLMVINDTQSSHTITTGNRTWTLKSLRAMEFIKTGDTVNDWYPIVGEGA